MSKTPFMPLWVSDFLGDTLDLDAAEVGAYMLLLMAQWNRDGNSLPDDHKKLQRVARCGRNWTRVWGQIERYFERDDDGIYSKRLRLEAQNVAAKRAVNAHNGARGGAAKALKSKEQSIANATNSLQRNASIPEPEPYINDDTNVSSRRSGKDEGFSDFWEIWPSKKNKQNAVKAWRKLSIESKRAAYAAVRAGWFDQWQAASPDANPIHAATYLNNRRWEDQQSIPHMRQIEGGRTNVKRSIAERLEARFSEMDSGQDRDPSKPLFSTSNERDGGGGGDDGLDQGVVRVFPRTDWGGM